MHRYEIFVDMMDGNAESYRRSATSEVEARRMVQHLAEQLEYNGTPARIELVLTRPGSIQLIQTWNVSPGLAPIAA